MLMTITIPQLNRSWIRKEFLQPYMLMKTMRVQLK